MDLDAVRTFVAVADAGQFSDAAADLSLSQQAVSKRVATLEQDVGVRLFDRTSRGIRLTIDGQAFLPHARGLLLAEERAAASVRPGRRALRVDVLGRRLAPASLLREFHGARPGVSLDVVTLFDFDAAVEAVRAGSIDASFRAVPRALPAGVVATPVFREPIELVTGPAHPLAGARAVTPGELVEHRMWMPGIVPGTEWADYYSEFAAAFGLSIDSVGPNFGVEPLLDVIADSSRLGTFVGERTRLLWPDHYDLRRISILDPVPVYPHSLVHREDNGHPALPLLVDHLVAGRGSVEGPVWQPAW